MLRGSPPPPSLPSSDSLHRPPGTPPFTPKVVLSCEKRQRTTNRHRRAQPSHEGCTPVVAGGTPGGRRGAVWGPGRASANPQTPPPLIRKHVHRALTGRSIPPPPPPQPPVVLGTEENCWSKGIGGGSNGGGGAAVVLSCQKEPCPPPPPPFPDSHTTSRGSTARPPPACVQDMRHRNGSWNGARPHPSCGGWGGSPQPAPGCILERASCTRTEWEGGRAGLCIKMGSSQSCVW